MSRGFSIWSGTVSSRECRLLLAWLLYYMHKVLYPRLLIRLVSVCAGVPVKRMVAGVAMGLIMEEDGKFQVLTDILGSEDALGDMDFKVAGDAEGVTAFQMDIKVSQLLVTCSHPKTILQIMDGRSSTGHYHGPDDHSFDMNFMRHTAG